MKPTAGTLTTTGELQSVLSFTLGHNWSDFRHRLHYTFAGEGLVVETTEREREREREREIDDSTASPPELRPRPFEISSF